MIRNKYFYIIPSALISALIVTGLCAIFCTEKNVTPCFNDSINSNEKSIGTAEVDLNWDGEIDRVLLSTSPNTDPLSSASRLFLTVNNEHVEIPSISPLGYFGLIDLRLSDEQIEIALSDAGASTDYSTSFYAYDGKSIKLIGTAQGLYHQMQFNGDGTFVTTTRASMLDTWFYRDTFELADNNAIVHVPKDFYERISPTNPVTILTHLTLQKSPTDTTKTLALQEGDVVTIVGCDDVAWCKIKNAQENTGWFAVDDYSIMRGTVRPASDYFDGLSFAD